MPTEIDTVPGLQLRLVLQKIPIYIYALRDPDSARIRYVGKTDNPSRRKEAHLSQCWHGTSYCQRWIAQLRRSGKSPTMNILEVVHDAAKWPEREQWWIAELRSRGEPLTNTSAGGRGALGVRHSAEAINKIRMRFKGIPLTEKHRHHLSVAQKIRFDYPSQRAHLAMKSSKLSTEDVLKIRQLSDEAELTQSEIARMYGVTPSQICSIHTGTQFAHLVKVPITTEHPSKIRTRRRIAQWLFLFRNGYSASKIALMYGYCANSVARQLRAYGGCTRVSERYLEVSKRHELIFKLHSEGKSNKEIAAIANISPGGVWRALKCSCFARHKNCSKFSVQ